MDCFLSILFGIILVVAAGYPSQADEDRFDDNYNVTWGLNHFKLLEQGKQVQLLIDEHSGSGFSSRQDYGSGYFRMRMKLPTKKTKGIITAFYLISLRAGNHSKAHDELDFEFLGGNGSMPYTLFTNVFVSDHGGREQIFNLWFNPTTDFHTYELLWNQHHIVFFVDQIPIRVFKNNRKLGVNYPSKSLHIETALWNNTNWLGKVDWSQAPFTAYYEGFDIKGCESKSSTDLQQCYSSSYPWNGKQFLKLSPDQQAKFENVRKKYMFHDYCSYSSKSHPECTTNH